MTETAKVWFKAVDIGPADTPSGGTGFRILLDGRAIRTRSRRLCLAPTRALAEAVAEEWRAQEGKIDFKTLPLTGLLFAVHDMTAAHRPRIEEELAAYGETDLVCFRADSPEELRARQRDLLEPVCRWAEERYDVKLSRATGIVAAPQPDETRARCLSLVRSCTDYELTAFNQLVRRSGSLFLGLAVREGYLTCEQAWHRSRIEEDWQRQQWGEDAEAAARADEARREFLTAARFLDLIKAS